MTQIGMLTSDQDKLNPRECVTHPFQVLPTSCYWLKQRISYMALPSGKLSQNYGKSQFFKAKSNISMAMFNSFLYVY